jgi:ankyrin repeat protein
VHNFDHLFVSALLKKGADVRALNDQKVSPLLLAYNTWELSDIRKVFESNNCSRLTPVEASQIAQQASKNGQHELLSYILAQWDHPQLANDLPVDFTPTLAVLRVLSEHALLDSSLTLSTMLGAWKDGHDDILRETLAQCTAAEIDEFLLVAIKENLPYDYSILRVLLEHDPAVFSKDEILLTACDGGHHDMVEMLVASGASANFLGIEGSRPVHHAAWHLDILQTLTSREADLAYRNRRGETALHLASARGALDCVKWLLEHGVSIDSKTAHGHVALHDAAQAGHDLVCQHLLESGADSRIRTRKTGSTPIHYAAEYGHLKAVKTLLNFEYDLLARDAWGGTPLHTAAYWGHVDIVEKLLEAGSVKTFPVIDNDSSGTSAGEVLLPDENAKSRNIH